MPRPDEGLIHAWLDGELEADEAARVERLVAEDAEWASAAAEARGLIAASSRILGALDVVAGDVIPQRPIVPRRAVPAWMKMAAGIALVAGIGYAARDGIGLGVPKETVPAVAEVQPARTADSSAPAVSAAVPEANPRTRVAAEAESRVRDDGARVESSARPSAGFAANAGAGAAPAPVASAPPPGADVVAQTVPVAPTAPPAPTAAAPTAPAPAMRRALEGNRLSDVVVTGMASGAARESTEPAAARKLQQQAAKAVAPAPAAALQADAPPPLPIIEGCFRIRTRARIDTLLIDPTILATDADSIRIGIPSARWAWVRRDSTGALVGRVWWQRGTSNMRADPIDCS